MRILLRLAWALIIMMALVSWYILSFIPRKEEEAKEPVSPVVPDRRKH